MCKVGLSAQDLLEDSFRLGLDVLESGFKPTMIIAIWRGGTPVGMAVQEILAYCGGEAEHIAIRTSSYVGVDERGSVPSAKTLTPETGFDDAAVSTARGWKFRPAMEGRKPVG